MAMKTIICLSFIILNNFFANMCVKKIVPHQPKASPHVTGSESFFCVCVFFCFFLLSLFFAWNYLKR